MSGVVVFKRKAEQAQCEDVRSKDVFLFFFISSSSYLFLVFVFYLIMDTLCFNTDKLSALYGQQLLCSGVVQCML